MGIRRLLICLGIFIYIFTFSLSADSFTFTTEIDGVSNFEDFGMNLFPVGTTFAYYNYFPTISKTRQSRFFLQGNMQYTYSWIDGSYDYYTGEPVWVNSRYDANNLNRNGSKYFNPNGYIEGWLEQGFGDNPVIKGGTLVLFRLGFNSRYSMALEKPGQTDYTFVNSDGTIKEPFGQIGNLHAFPWLEGNRKTLNNHIFLRSYWYLNRNIAYDFDEGFYAEVQFDYGPSWLFNTQYPGGVQSDFYRVYGYFEEKLSLFDLKQDNGKTWSYIYLGHANTVNYVGGEVVPLNKLPGDRLRWSISDRIWIRFMGPQFIADDCYGYIELSLNNNLYFGNVVNEVSQATKAIEFQSSLSTTFHLRLFGFIRFDYNFGYNMARGIWPHNPGWWQNAKLNFYVSI